MKLISLQSHGNKMAAIWLNDGATYYVECLTLMHWLGKHGIVKAPIYRRRQRAFKAAEQWLKGGNQ
jgi:hypothetical protein